MNSAKTKYKKLTLYLKYLTSKCNLRFLQSFVSLRYTSTICKLNYLNHYVTVRLVSLDPDTFLSKYIIDNDYVETTYVEGN